MSPPPLLYRTLIAAARRLAPRPTRLTMPPAGEPHAGAPLLLVHAASAGELRQAEPVLRRFRTRHPEWRAAASYFSPSARHVAETLPLEAHGLAPWDGAEDVAALLDGLRPTAIVVAKHDLWLTFAHEAAARSIPVLLIAATVRPGSGRLRWPARPLLAPAYASLAAIGAVSPDDADRLTRVGADPGRITVVGDPRYDGVLERIAGLPRPAAHSATLVAGSTWPADDAVLLASFRRVRQERPDARLILIPHRPTPAGMIRITERAHALGLPGPVRLESADSRDPLVVLDRLGPLAELYPLGVMAYVGGGFGRAGIHSCLEPAAWGVPVIVGPASLESADAIRLHAAKALHRLPARRAAAVLEAWWLQWLADPEWRREAGRAARRTVEEHAGAADRTVLLMERALGMTEGGPAARPVA